MPHTAHAASRESYTGLRSSALRQGVAAVPSIGRRSPCATPRAHIAFPSRVPSGRGGEGIAMAGSSSRPTTPCEMRRRGTRGCRVAALPMHAHNAVPPESSCVFSVKPPPSPVSHQLHVHVCLLCGTVGGSLEARANRHVASSLQPPPRHSKYSVPLRNELTSENPFHGSHRPFSQSI